jgi:hypothetical protein
MNEVIIREKELPIEVKKLLDSNLFKDIETKVEYTSLGQKISKPLDKRLNDSKFAGLIKDIPTNELVVLTMILGFSGKGLSAINMYLTAENTRIQRYALKLELQKRQSKR